MSEKRNRLDESFSKKAITGNSDVEIDISTITISPSGNVQPANSPQDSQDVSDSGQSQGLDGKIGCDRAPISQQIRWSIPGRVVQAGIMH